MTYQFTSKKRKFLQKKNCENPGFREVDGVSAISEKRGRFRPRARAWLSRRMRAQRLARVFRELYCWELHFGSAET